MKGLMIVGVLLTVIGISGFIFGGVNWTETETVAELGSFKITDTDEKGFHLPPVASGVCVAVGVIFVALGAMRK